MKLYFYILLVTIFCVNESVSAQELNASVTINTLSLQASQTDPKVFKTLENSIKEFLNSTSFTDLKVGAEERIKCSFQMTIQRDEGSNAFGASLVIQSTRPVYGSEYETVVFTFNDENFNFNYEEFQPIRLTQNSFQNNLSSVLSFYAYVIIGLDMETFSRNGGNEYLLTAQSIKNAAPTNNASSFPGWASGDRSKINRFNLIEELLSAQLRVFREAYYQYHRKGLDILYEEIEVGRDNIQEAINTISFSARNTTTVPILIQIFLDSKGVEIVEIFEPSPVFQKRKVYDLIVGMNPGISDKFKSLR